METQQNALQAGLLANQDSFLSDSLPAAQSKKKKKPPTFCIKASICLSTLMKLIGTPGDAYYFALVMDLFFKLKPTETGASKVGMATGTSLSIYSTASIMYCGFTSSMRALRKKEKKKEAIQAIEERRSNIPLYILLMGCCLDITGDKVSSLGIAAHYIIEENATRSTRILMQCAIIFLGILASIVEIQSALSKVEKTFFPERAERTKQANWYNRASIWLCTAIKLLGMPGDAFYAAVLYDLFFNMDPTYLDLSYQGLMLGFTLSAYTTASAMYCSYQAGIHGLKPEKLELPNDNCTLSWSQYAVIAGCWLDTYGDKAASLGIAAHYLLSEEIDDASRIAVQLAILSLAIVASILDFESSYSTIKSAMKWPSSGNVEVAPPLPSSVPLNPFNLRI